MANAITTAAGSMPPGSVLLLELAMQGAAGVGFDCNEDGTANDGDQAPLEWDPMNFDAIATATMIRKVHVIEPAGNGNCDLEYGGEEAGFTGRFDSWSPSFTQSGAVIVGASYISNSTPVLSPSVVLRRTRRRPALHGLRRQRCRREGDLPTLALDLLQ